MTDSSNRTRPGANDPSDYLRPTSPDVATTGLPGTGGRIGDEPAHFVVSEIPAYEPSGEGDHVYLRIEKTGMNTRDVARYISREAGVPERDIGVAGMKDKWAITEQWFSLPKGGSPVSEWTPNPAIRVVKESRHKNKLRTGHLHGNRFSVTLVDVAEDALEKAQAIAQALNDQGLINYYGPQRFGRGGRNLGEALKWLQGEVEERKAQAAEGSGAETEEHDEPAPKKRRKKNFRQRGPDAKLLSSVVQSEIFNRYAEQRVQDERPLLLGEVVRLKDTGSHFIVKDLEAELPRRLKGDLLPTAPMIGPKGLIAESDARALELQAATSLGLDDESLAALGRHAPGARRDLFLAVDGLRVEQPSPGQLVLHFELPAGAYATQVAREFTRSPWDSPRVSFPDSAD